MAALGAAWFPPPHVGATPAELAAQGTATADVYTYGAASQALAEGQAMQAWAELAKEQNYPKIKEVAVKFTCPPGWLISPDGTTCVNQENVHIALGDKGSCALDAANSNLGWWYCAELPSYMRLNEGKALSSGSRHQIVDAALRGLRAMRMTTGNYGWTHVRSQLRALAWMLARGSTAFEEFGEGWGPGDDVDIDELAFELEKSIGPYYDKDQKNPAAAAALSNQVISDLILAQHVVASSTRTGMTALLFGVAAVGAAALAALLAPGATGALAGAAARGVARLYLGARRAIT